MNKGIAIFAFLIACSIPTVVSAQSSGTSTRPIFSKALLNSLFLSGLFSVTEHTNKSTTIPHSGVAANVHKSLDPDLNNIENFHQVQFKYAMILDVTLETLVNSSLYKFIDNWFGTRYRMGGNSKRGIDCSAFTSTLLMAVYSFAAPRTAREQYSACNPVSKSDLTEGDLVFFNTTGGISHVGLFLANGYFVHCCSSGGVSISNLEDSYYSRKFIGGGRLMQ